MVAVLEVGGALKRWAHLMIVFAAALCALVAQKQSAAEQLQGAQS